MYCLRSLTDYNAIDKAYCLNAYGITLNKMLDTAGSCRGKTYDIFVFFVNFSIHGG